MFGIRWRRGSGEKASLRTVELGPGYLEDREKQPSFPGRLTVVGATRGGGGSEVSASPTLKAVQRGLAYRDGDRAV